MLLCKLFSVEVGLVHCYADGWRNEASQDHPVAIVMDETCFCHKSTT